MRAYAIVRQYAIPPAARNEFERSYGPDGGAWSSLFRVCPGSPGTRLLRDTALPDRYVTLDLWRTEAAFAAFVAERRADYRALDSRCDALTATEVCLDTFWITAEAGHGPPG